MRIELNLVLSVILEAVKAETYLKGRVDRATIEHGEQLAYHETAGDEVTHERKLMRCIYTSADRLRGWLQDYVANEGGHGGDNDFKFIINEGTDSIRFELVVSDRFNKSNNDALARLMSKWIEDNTLVLWWGTFNEKEAAFYQGLLTEDLHGIERLFIKTAPSVPTPSYTTKIECGGAVTLTEGEEHVLTYVTDGDCIDDVDWCCNRPRLLDVVKGKGCLHLHGCRVGRCVLVLYSRHNSEVSREVEVVIGGH